MSLQEQPKARLPLILTPGDPDGIGPEITWKVLKKSQKQERPLLVIGAKKPFEKLGAPLIELDPNAEELIPPLAKEPVVWILPAPDQCPENRFLSGYQAGWSIEKATNWVLQGKAAALVTGPIHKERLQRGGFIYPGHTEFLAELCQRKERDSSLPKFEVTMMLANDILRVSLVTTHLSLKEVSPALSIKKLHRAILQTASGLRQLWKIDQPRIAVAALNPHAGESGLFGREEIDLIEPALRELRESLNGVEILGPLPADTLFAKHYLAPPHERFDAVVCMYHDQGLIPVKLLDFHRTVNVTLGLPIIRTSVDHGVAFDIAGRGVANPSSLDAAIEMANLFVR